MNEDISEPQTTEDSDNSLHRPDRPDFLTETSFTQFGLAEEVLSGVEKAGFTYCTPIQAEVIPLGLEGKDVAGQAQTGTGKTAAFLVPIFNRLLELSDRRAGLPSVLIIAPTRELAIQIYDDALVLGHYTGFTQGLVIGGIDYQRQADVLTKGVDLVIGTPGRMIDYIKQGVLKTSKIRFLVVDEADRLLDMGFIKDLRYILGKLPHYRERQSMLFSATLSYRVPELTYEYMKMPEFISVTPDKLTVENIEQSLFHVGRENKIPLLLGLLKREEWTRVLIFVNTKSGVEWVSKKLKGNNLPAEGITGDLPQRQRLSLMKNFKDGTTRILVATDVASRGIHVEDISHVINYDLPQDVENYVHRIGRTARAGHTGKAISLACEEYVFHLAPLEEYLDFKIPVVWPEDEWFEEDKAGHVGRSRRPPSSRPGKKSGMSGPKPAPREKTGPAAQPGGIFGLAVARRASGQPEEKIDTKKPARKKRPRRRKKPAKPAESTPQATDKAT
jgi:ATP-dependent RNA helicase RhlB